MAAKKIVNFTMKLPGGFSLSELVIVLAVMAILLTIAVPGYRQYIQRIERADAIRWILEVAGCQERIRAATGFYDTTQCTGGSENEAYSFQVKPPGETSSTGFEIVAKPVRNSGNDCGDLSLDHTGTRRISSETGTLSACWGGR